MTSGSHWSLSSFQGAGGLTSMCAKQVREGIRQGQRCFRAPGTLCYTRFEPHRHHAISRGIVPNCSWSSPADSLKRNLNNCFAYDLVPSPSVITAAVRAARRVNDFPSAVRVFEGTSNQHHLLHRRAQVSSDVQITST
jgi:hypothetical protein